MVVSVGPGYLLEAPARPAHRANLRQTYHISNIFKIKNISSPGSVSTGAFAVDRVLPCKIKESHGKSRKITDASRELMISIDPACPPETPARPAHYANLQQTYGKKKSPPNISDHLGGVFQTMFCSLVQDFLLCG